MIDFHTHILPAVDDGSEDMNMSHQMLNISVNEGVDYICATPHFIVEEFEIDKTEYCRRLAEIKNQSNGMRINILPGLEVYIHPDLPELYRTGRIWGLNHTKYVLIELPMREFPIYTERVLYGLRLEGAVPVIAHPERNLRILQKQELLVNLVEQGTLVQVNAGSLMGMYGSSIKKFAERLVDMNMVHLLGSDGHNNFNRPTRIRQAYDVIEHSNKSLFNWIVDNEKHIIENDMVEVPEIIISKKRKYIFFDIFRH